MADQAPGKVEATAIAVAGPAFALSLLFLRQATGFAPGLFDASAAALVALGLAPWTHRLRGPSAATAVRGGGLAVGALLLAKSLVPPFVVLVGPSALAIVGGTLLQANARAKQPTGWVDVVGVGLIGAAIAYALAVAQSFPEPERLRLTLGLVGLATLAGLALRRVLVALGRGALAPMPLGIMLVASVGGIYLSYRSLVRAQVENLPLYEWSAGAALVALVLARLRRSAKQREAPDAWSGDARRHAQDVRPVYDERMGPLAATIGRWLERGEGFDAYSAAMRAYGAAVGTESSQHAGGRTRSARREQAQARLAAHESALSFARGPPHGATEPRLR